MARKVKETGVYRMEPGITKGKGKGMHMMPGGMPMKDSEMKAMMGARKRKGKTRRNA